MLICKNCDSENTDGAKKCCNCQMEDQLVYISPDKEHPKIVKVDHPPLACANCGYEAPGEGEKCIECHFPIPNARKQNGNSIFPQHTHPIEGFELTQ
ncbi:MAG: hypothetical protein AB8H47_24390 [Bacteroidia bacterium]